MPHGIDNDIMFGLTNAYINANCPEDNTIRITAYQLLQLSALTINGHNYASIRHSLKRLRNSTFTVDNSWYDREEETFQSISTSLVQNWKFIERRKKDTVIDTESLQGNAILQVALDPDLARSIRLGYIRPINLQILKTLSQPLTRTLYRRLEDERHPLDRPTQMIFQTALLPWADRLGINGRPDTIRRALSAPHTQLIEQGFLTEVNYLGRGKQQDIQYVFSHDSSYPSNPELVKELTKRGITRGAALKYVGEWSPEAIYGALKRRDELIDGGYRPKNPSGLLVDILRDPEKYQTVKIDIDAGKKPKQKAEVTQPRLLEEPDQEVERDVRTAEFLLKGARNLDDAVKLEAVELFLKGLVRSTELRALSKDEDPSQTVFQWRLRTTGAS